MYGTKSSRNESFGQEGYEPYEKEFRLRESPLIEVFEKNVVGKVMYNLLSATFLYMLITSLVKDYVTQREVGIFEYIVIKFGGLDRVFIIWLGFNAAACVSYFCFRLWARVRFDLKPMYIRIWDSIWIILMFWFYITPFRYSLQLSALPMGTASKSIITGELLRIMMKIYAFVRSNVPKCLKMKPHVGSTSDLPKISAFIYFLYAPTFIYRDTYPRSAKIRWGFVISRILELVALILFVALFFFYGFHPMFHDFCARKYQLSEILLLSFQSGIFGAWIIWLTGVLILHSIQNIVGELLRFGDRLSYDVWWNCNSYSEYFRKWNVVVSEWLYFYVIRDMYEYVIPGRKKCAKLMAFLLSAVAHEWAILVIAGFILPVNGVFFLSACFMSFFLSESKYFNLIHWLNQFVGCGTIFTFILLEHYARVNLKLNSGEVLPVMFTYCIT